MWSAESYMILHISVQLNFCLKCLSKSKPSPSLNLIMFGKKIDEL